LRANLANKFMDLKSNFPLKAFNSLGIDVKAKLFAEPVTFDELIKILKEPDLKKERKLILGGGSNVLFISDFDGLVIHPQLFEKTIIEKKANYVIVNAQAGEIWDSFVEWTIHYSFAGLENLSLIPGTVGACPVQNIGAYGVEVGDLIEKVEAIEIETGKIRRFSNEECKFGYRNSIFKNEIKDQYIITSVYFKLSQIPEFKINYGALKDELANSGQINLKTVRQAIINIRQSKLPDPKLIPNAGSFFKNPSIPKEIADNLKLKYPEMVCYNNSDGTVKVAAGWLIEYLAWKGKTHHGAGVHEKQALVLINKNFATGKEILELANKIKESIILTFGIELEFEVNVI
jgi:UDP-N-acetylmuramate dehydrogenase